MVESDSFFKNRGNIHEPHCAVGAGAAAFLRSRKHHGGKKTFLNELRLFQGACVWQINGIQNGFCAMSFQ